MKKLAVITLCVWVIFAVTGCSGKDSSSGGGGKGKVNSKLVGVWESEGIHFVLNNDGSASMIVKKQAVDGTWSSDKENFTANFEGAFSFTSPYSFEGDKLKAEIEGDKVTFTRVNLKNKDVPPKGVWEQDISASTPYYSSVAKMEITDKGKGNMYYGIDLNKPISFTCKTFGDSIYFISEYGCLWYDSFELKDGLLSFHGTDSQKKNAVVVFKTVKK